MKRLLFCLSLLLTSFLSPAQLRIVSYNVENLFDTEHDSLKYDQDFLPDGKYHWTLSRYINKINNLSRVIVSIGEWQIPAIVGLCEVENERCLKDLVENGPLRKQGYRYVHRESPDQRGIDCALLYQPKKFQLLSSDFFSVPLPEDERPTREIVYAKGIFNKRDTLHVMLCHLPSQLGGTQKTAHKRAIALGVLQQKVDSLLSLNVEAQIIIMGDMNMRPVDALRGMHNLMLHFEERNEGTHKWQGEWSCLDQFYVSDALVDKSVAHIYAAEWLQCVDDKYGGMQPYRCFYGYEYRNGYSDHLPVYLEIVR